MGTMCVRIIYDISLTKSIRLEQDNNVRLNPKEVKREIINSSKKFGITPQEGAEFVGIILKNAYDKTMAEIEAITSKPE